MKLPSPSASRLWERPLLIDEPTPLAPLVIDEPTPLTPLNIDEPARPAPPSIDFAEAFAAPAKSEAVRWPSPSASRIEPTLLKEDTTLEPAFPRLLSTESKDTRCTLPIMLLAAPFPLLIIPPAGKVPDVVEQVRSTLFNRSATVGDGALRPSGSGAAHSSTWRVFPASAVGLAHALI